jgi:hypothetical protein
MYYAVWNNPAPRDAASAVLDPYWGLLLPVIQAAMFQNIYHVSSTRMRIGKIVKPCVFMRILLKFCAI